MDTHIAYATIGTCRSEVTIFDCDIEQKFNSDTFSVKVEFDYMNGPTKSQAETIKNLKVFGLENRLNWHIGSFQDGSKHLAFFFFFDFKVEWIENLAWAE